MEQLRKSSRGLMFTLVTVVIVVLMLGEVLTYLYTNTQYSNLGVQATPSLAASTLYTQINASMQPFLQTSLRNAFTALSAYETSNFVSNGISNGPQALESLMDNGTVYGVNMNSQMGSYTLSGYANTLRYDANVLGIGVAMSNINVIVYQGSGGEITAALLTNLNVSSQYGTVSYPIDANASVSLSGLQDLFGGNLGSQISYSSNSSFVVGNAYAPAANGSTFVGGNIISNALTIKSGSLSGYLFASGSLFVDNVVSQASPSRCSDPGISSVPSGSRSSYILVAPNAPELNSNFCGFAGLLTYNANTLDQSGPMIVYNAPASGSNGILGDLKTGVGYVLDGNTLTLSDASGLQSAVYQGAYVPSSFAPTYLNLISGSQLAFSPYGTASLGIATRYAGSFFGVGNIIAYNAPVNTVSGGINTVSFWMQWTANQPGSGAMVAVELGNYLIEVTPGALGVGGSGDLFSNSTTDLSTFATTPWINIVAVLTNGASAGSSETFYVDGVKKSLTTSGSTPISASGPISIGGYSGSYFTGKIADVQVYNAMLTPYQAESLYLGGINSAPVNYSDLAGWWPLNGNPNDYSRYHDNGTANSLLYTYSRLMGYPGDTLGGGSFYGSSVAGVEGISQCYSRASCGWNGPGKIYALVQPAYATNSLQPAANSLGFFNNTIPDSAYFDGAESSEYQSSGPYSSTGTVSFWMDAISPSGTSVPFSFGGSTLSLTSGSGLCLAGGSCIAANTVINKWVSVIVTTSGYIYINGVGTNTGGTFAPGGTIYIGGSSGSNFFSGSLADVQAYNTVLATNQISSLYLNNTVPGLRPVGWWPLGSGFGGYNNQTTALVGNVAYEYKSGTICLEANSLGIVGSPCGIVYLPFGPR